MDKKNFSIILSVLIIILLVGIIIQFYYIYGTQGGKESMISDYYEDNDSSENTTIVDSNESNNWPTNKCDDDNDCSPYLVCQNSECIQPKCNDIPYSKGIQECVGNKIILQSHTKKIGVLYLYSFPETYNPDWSNDLTIPFDNALEALKNLTDGKADYSYEMIGEMQTNIFEWTSAQAGIKYNKTMNITNFYDDGTLTNDIYPSIQYDQCLGSAFKLLGGGFLLHYDETKRFPEHNLTQRSIFNGEVENNCPHTVEEIEFDEIRNYTFLHISFDSDNPVGGAGKWRFIAEAGEKLDVDFSNYDEIVIVFGRFGDVLPEDPYYLYPHCTWGGGTIKGWSSLFFGENSLRMKVGLIPCGREDISSLVGDYYESNGWETLTHELLHLLGAVDVYETTIGSSHIATSYEEALMIDPNINASIMGKRDLPCFQEFKETGEECTEEEINYIYLDKLNRQLIGLE